MITSVLSSWSDISQLHEAEADHIAIILMAKTSFNPRAFMTHLERRTKNEEMIRNWPDILRTHPPVRIPESTYKLHCSQTQGQERVKAISTLLPTAMTLYEQNEKEDFVLEEWDYVRQDLQRRLDDQQRTPPRPKLLDVVTKLDEMHETIRQLQEQFNDSRRYMEESKTQSAESISESAHESIDEIQEVPHESQQQSNPRKEPPISEQDNQVTK